MVFSAYISIWAKVSRCASVSQLLAMKAIVPLRFVIGTSCVFLMTAGYIGASSLRYKLEGKSPPQSLSIIRLKPGGVVVGVRFVKRRLRAAEGSGRRVTQYTFKLTKK